ncbi:MAG: hypothetical protein ABSG12_07510, partial [Steroidobacteraceae bacterium]
MGDSARRNVVYLEAGRPNKVSVRCWKNAVKESGIVGMQVESDGHSTAEDIDKKPTDCDARRLDLDADWLLALRICQKRCR